MNNLVVIARYQEDINWVKKLNCNYLIYNKGESIPEEYKQIPNIGREGETYIRYIIEFYNNLPDYVTFVQGNPFFHYSNLINHLNNFQPEDKIVNLSDTILRDNPDPPLMSYNVKFLELNYNETSYTFPTGAQFIIPKKYITNKSLKWWEKCYNLYISDNNNPWSFERIWPLIFNHENNL